jgi:hypothetical protein
MNLTINGTIYRAGRICEPVTAKRKHTCDQCRGDIVRGDQYRSVTIAGGGLSSIKNPDRVHESCFEEWIIDREHEEERLQVRRDEIFEEVTRP